MEEKVSTLHKAQEEEQSKRLIGSAIKAGQIAPALREWAIAYHSQDAEGFAQFLERQTPLLPQASQPASAPLKAILSPAEQSICAQLGIDPHTFAQARQNQKDADSPPSTTL